MKCKELTKLWCTILHWGSVVYDTALVECGVWYALGGVVYDIVLGERGVRYCPGGAVVYDITTRRAIGRASAGSRALASDAWQQQLGRILIAAALFENPWRPDIVRCVLATSCRFDTNQARIAWSYQEVCSRSCTLIADRCGYGGHYDVKENCRAWIILSTVGGLLRAQRGGLRRALPYFAGLKEVLSWNW